MMDEENKGDLHNQEDVNPGSELGKLVDENDEEQLPLTNGTGSNNPVPREGSLIIRDESEDIDDSDDDQIDPGSTDPRRSPE
jgi:hypothetical protein